MNILRNLGRIFFQLLIIRPVVTIVIGLRVHRRQNIPLNGPALIVANHNSHLDMAVITSLFPIRQVHKIKSVAAADYFFNTKLKRIFSNTFLNLIPLQRKTKTSEKNSVENLLKPIFDSLQNNDIVIFFPEGSRGSPEALTKFRRGIEVIAAKFPNLPIFPIFLHGLGKSLPKGDPVLVPFFCDVVTGSPLFGKDHPNDFAETLKREIEELKSSIYIAEWK